MVCLVVELVVVLFFVFCIYLVVVLDVVFVIFFGCFERVGNFVVFDFFEVLVFCVDDFDFIGEGFGVGLFFGGVGFVFFFVFN